ncbi:rab11 family-interacting protein 1 isoform X2 [Schistocerca serialis cubense]|uniref:rab11 family-interacting protein 1 isoform X2 n=1 Tax=Schistocerca serialis cubense TaxID=2023355 RepID=UPI00214E2235|nr:rab11 family-interacting protein 1 isoform X2 [Schistocerca serialis cubense]
MWSPTHVLVTVHRARGLLTKGRNGTNDAFVTIALGKEKYQTSVKEKADKDVEWHEECELPIPKQGNTAEIVLTALHRNFMGVDEFLGVINIPLADFDVYERPRCKWYELKSKPGKEKQKHRGELEVKVTFIVKAGSLTDLSKKEKHKSLGQLSHMAQSVGGSLLSIGSLEKRKSLKKIAKSIGKKVGKGSNSKLKEESFDGNLGPSHRRIGQIAGEADPGVISEDEDEFTFDDLSHKSSLSSLSTSQQTAATPPAGSLENLAGGEFLRRTNMTGTASVPPKPPRSVSQDKTVDEWEQKLYGKQGKDSVINNSDTLKRRSWDTSKSFTMSQCEDKEFDNITHASTPAIVRANTIDTPVAALRKINEDIPRNVTETITQDDKEKEKTKEKEKDISKLARRFNKHFRKGDPKNEEAIPEVKTPTAEERIIIGGENDDKKVRTCGNKTPDSVIQKYENNTKEELISIIYNLQLTVEDQNKKVKDLEDYLDNLLLRVMETTPRILQNPYVSVKTEIDSRNMVSVREQSIY